MITTTVTEFIPVSARTAFGFAAEMRNLDQWGVGVRTVRQTAGDGPGAGAAYECTMFSSIIGPKATYRMLELVEDKRLVMAGETAQMTFTDTYVFEPAGHGVNVTITDELRLRGWFTAMESLFAPLMKIQIARDLANLKTALASFSAASEPEILKVG